MPALSVIVCTYNPRPDYLKLTLEALRGQTLPGDRAWELIVVDNASSTPLDLDLRWCSNARIVREDRPGLVYARLRSFTEARGDIFVFVDDDNVLESNYLQRAFSALISDETLGAAGGKVIARYEAEPPTWFPA